MTTTPLSRRIALGLCGALGLGLIAASPAAAEPAQSGGDKMNLVIIYGNDECPPSKGDEITVCARKDESERYRIPAPFRDHPAPGNEAWTNRVIAYESVGATGAQSCSPVGAGGWTGCEAKFIRNGMAEKKAQSDVQFSKLIDAERQKRLQDRHASGGNPGRCGAGRKGLRSPQASRERRRRQGGCSGDRAGKRAVKKGRFWGGVLRAGFSRETGWPQTP